jgi:hypothetical protein
MKKYITVVLLAILTGSILGYYTFHGFKASAKDIKQVYLIQLGVYSSKENAINKRVKMSNSIIIKEGDYYHVYANIFSSSSLVDKVKKYYDNKKIHYYIKTAEIDVKTYNELQKYESILEKVDDVSVINKTSEKMLLLYQNYRGQNED